MLLLNIEDSPDFGGISGGDRHNNVAEANFLVPQKASETEGNAVTVPPAITGTAEELDRELPQQLVDFTATCSRQSDSAAQREAERQAKHLFQSLLHRVFAEQSSASQVASATVSA